MLILDSMPMMHAFNILWIGVNKMIDDCMYVFTTMTDASFFMCMAMINSNRQYIFEPSREFVVQFVNQ
jgi:hypothetical protein